MRVIYKLIAAGLFSITLSTIAYAEEPPGAEEARAVIRSQLSAFEDEAVDTAYGFAAPNIQRIFPTPEVFGRMVRNGYPMVWNPSETFFLGAEQRGDTIVQSLRIVDQAGIPFIAEYQMVMIDGKWRISGVQIKKDDSYGA